MQLSRWELKAKERKMVTCLMTFVMFSLLWVLHPGPAGATNQSNDGYPPAQGLEIWVGYSGDASKTYTKLKTFQQSELEGMQDSYVYTFIDNMPCTVVDPAVGVQLTDILAACDIDENNVNNFRFWTSDVPGQPYQTLSKGFLLDTARYYFPCIADNWELAEGGFYDPTAGYSGDSDIYFPDSVAAAAYKVEVPTMLAFSDHWQRVFSGESGDTSFSNLTGATRYRLVFGHPDDLASDHPTHTASKSSKWVYRMDVTLNGVPPGVALNKTTAAITVGGSCQLTATVSPNTASQSVAWTSGNTAVATVTSTGLVTAVAPGSATITAITADGGLTATCAVTVTAKSAPVAQNPPGAASDISGHWAEDNIKKLVAMGIISGYPDGAFLPDNAITRAEFAVMLEKAFKIAQQDGQVFADTAGHWAEKYIATATTYGIVNGYGDSSFGPDDPVTREQMAVMIIKAAKLSPAAGEAETQFADSGSISDWAVQAVAMVTKEGIMKGYLDNTFRPQGRATRAEAVTAVINALNR